MTSSWKKWLLKTGCSNSCLCRRVGAALDQAAVGELHPRCVCAYMYICVCACVCVCVWVRRMDGKSAPRVPSSLDESLVPNPTHLSTAATVDAALKEVAADRIVVGEYNVRILTDHPTSKFAATNLLQEKDCVVADYHDQDPATSPNAVQPPPPNATPVESIRVRYSEDPALQNFMRDLEAAWPSDSDANRVQILSTKVMAALGGVPDATDQLDVKSAGSVCSTMAASGMPFVSLGLMIGQTANCRYRALLFKFACDFTALHPDKFKGKPLRCHLRRNYLKMAHNGLTPHSYCVIRADGKEHVVDLEKSTQPIDKTAAEYETYLGPILAPPTPSVAPPTSSIKDAPKNISGNDGKGVSGPENHGQGVFGHDIEGVFGAMARGPTEPGAAAAAAAASEEKKQKKPEDRKGTI